MVLKLWDIDNGKVTYLKHTNSKNESRLVKLKEPIDCDRIPLSELDNAIELMAKFISSIKKFDDSTVVNGEKDIKVEAELDRKIEANLEKKIEVKPDDNAEVKQEDKVEIKPEKNAEVKPRPDVFIRPWIKATKQDENIEVESEDNAEVKPEDKVDTRHENNAEVEPEDKVETKSENNAEVEPDDNVETKPEDKVEIKPDDRVETKLEDNVEKLSFVDEYDIEEEGKEVPQEVGDKLNLLLQEDEGKGNGVRYLINKNAKKGVYTDKSSLSLPSNKTEIAIIPKKDVFIRSRSKRERKQRFSRYRKGVLKCVPEILKDIAKSNDDKILINASVFAKKMGEEFVNVKHELLYSNIRYKLFDYDIIVTMLSNEETGIDTNKDMKVFRFRIKNDHDKLPPSVLKQRNEI